MQTIATKIAAVKTVFAAAFPDADDKFISHAIHGVGDSPRRACRLAAYDAAGPRRGVHQGHHDRRAHVMPCRLEGVPDCSAEGRRVGRVRRSEVE